MDPERRVALCVARFYEQLADRLEAGARDALQSAGVTEIDRYDVPEWLGALKRHGWRAGERGRVETRSCGGACR